MADFIDEIEEIEKIQANDFLMEDDDECAAIITSPEVSPGLYEHFDSLVLYTVRYRDFGDHCGYTDTLRNEL